MIFFSLGDYCNVKNKMGEKMWSSEAQENEFWSKKAFHMPSRGVVWVQKMWYFCQNSKSGTLSSHLSVLLLPGTEDAYRRQE